MQLAFFYNQPEIRTEFIDLIDGVLFVRKNYCWDGASGPTVDTKNTILPSLPHDALFQLIRNGYLSHEWYKEADAELYRLLALGGMSKIRLFLWKLGLGLTKGSAAKAKNIKKILVAP